MPVHSTFKAMLFQRCTANNVTKAQKKKMEENEFFFFVCARVPILMSSQIYSSWNGMKNMCSLQSIPFEIGKSRGSGTTYTNVSYESYINAYNNISNNINKMRKYEPRIDMIGVRRGERKRCEYFQMIHINITACYTHSVFRSTN